MSTLLFCQEDFPNAMSRLFLSLVGRTAPVRSALCVYGARSCRSAAILFAIGGILGLIGCGGGGGSVSNTNPGQPESFSLVSGATTDINSNPILGATVQIGGLQ